MRRLTELDQYRSHVWENGLIAARGGGAWPPDLGGCFILPYPRNNVQLRCFAGIGEGWDHVSITTSEPRCATWDEMEFVKRAFFLETEAAMQLHVPPADHISHHPYCLHLWRPHAAEIPMPPKWMIA